MVAFTLKVYIVPTDRPGKVVDVEVPSETVTVDSSAACMVYPVITLPPLSDGTVHVMVAVVLLASILAVPIVGAELVVYGVTTFDESE